MTPVVSGTQRRKHGYDLKSDVLLLFTLEPLSRTFVVNYCQRPEAVFFIIYAGVSPVIRDPEMLRDPRAAQKL